MLADFGNHNEKKSHISSTGKHQVCKTQGDVKLLADLCLSGTAEFSKPNLEASDWLNPLLFYFSNTSDLQGRQGSRVLIFDPHGSAD